MSIRIRARAHDTPHQPESVALGVGRRVRPESHHVCLPFRYVEVERPTELQGGEFLVVIQAALVFNSNWSEVVSGLQVRVRVGHQTEFFEVVAS